MIYLQLFLAFLQIGAFSFGGGYAAMPLIQTQVVIKYGWLTLSDFTDLVTIAEMTPGPIARYRKLSIMQGVLQSLRPAVVSMIFSAGLSILLTALFANGTISFLPGNFQALSCILVLAALICLRRFKLNPILVMAACGVAELLFQMISERL